MEALKKKCSPDGSFEKKGSPDGSCGGGGVSVGTSSHLDQAVLVAAPANLNVKTKSVKKTLTSRCQWPASSSCPCHKRCRCTSSAARSPSSSQSSSGRRRTWFRNNFSNFSMHFVPGAIFSGDSDLLGALGHLKGCF